MLTATQFSALTTLAFFASNGRLPADLDQMEMAKAFAALAPICEKLTAEHVVFLMPSKVGKAAVIGCPELANEFPFGEVEVENV